jgi:hypothetical protein
MKEFLNPKSMVTPGAAGALMMLLANALCAVFPELAFRFVAVAISFLIGFAILASADIRLRERAMYGIVNSLVIFAVGVGTSNATASAAATASATADTPHAAMERPKSLVAPAETGPVTGLAVIAPGDSVGFFKRW